MSVNSRVAFFNGVLLENFTSLWRLVAVRAQMRSVYLTKTRKRALLRIPGGQSRYRNISPRIDRSGALSANNGLYFEKRLVQNRRKAKAKERAK